MIHGEKRVPTLSFVSGSEAAAATAVVMATKSLSKPRQPQTIEFKVDRPFLFCIRELRHDTTLFRGKFLTPPHADPEFVRL